MRSRRTFDWVTSTPHFSHVVLHGPEDLRAEESVALRLEGAVVDGLGLFDFAIRPGTDHLRRGESDLDRVKMLDRSMLFKELE
jgi:hypothetical protein